MKHDAKGLTWSHAAMRLHALLFALVVSGCGSLTPPMMDGGAGGGTFAFGGGTASGGGTATTGGGTGGGTGTTGGGTTTGGGDGTTGGGAATGGGDGVTGGGVATGGGGMTGGGDGTTGGGAATGGGSAVPDAGICGGNFCAPEMVAAQLIDPWDIAVNGTHVYWLEYGLATNGLDGQLMKLAKNTTCLQRDAGCSEDINTYFQGRFRVDSMALTPDELCWTEHYHYARDVVCQGLVTYAERYVARNQPIATEPVFANGALFWVNQGTTGAASDGQVQRVSLTGTPTPTSIATNRPYPNAVAVFDDHWVWSENGVTAADAGAVWAQPFDGGSAFAIATQQRSAISVVRCNDRPYWLDFRAGTVMRGDVGADSGVVLVTGQKTPFQVVCDDRNLYWLNQGVSANGADGELWQADLDTGNAALMVQGISLAWALAVDDTHVYYIAQGTQTRINGIIWRIRKHR